MVPIEHDDPALPVKIVVGPRIDDLAAELAFVLVDNRVRIFSLGTGVQVAISPPSPMLPVSACIRAHLSARHRRAAACCLARR